jgi:hypothetical protein
MRRRKKRGNRIYIVDRNKEARRRASFGMKLIVFNESSQLFRLFDSLAIFAGLSVDADDVAGFDE